MRPNWSVPALRPASEVFKILCLKGSAFEMGRQHGECLRDEIVYAIHRCIERFALSQQGWHRDTLLAFAQQLAQGLPDAYREELQGISAGSGASMDDLLLWNFFDDYWEVCGCSAFAASGARTASGAMLVGHNIDFPEDGSQRVAVTIIREPTQGMPSLCHAWAGIVGTYEGMNLQGLVIANQFSETDDDDPGGVPIKVVNRMLLDRCTCPIEAAELIRSVRRNFGSNILVADRERALVVECSGRDVVVRQAHAGVLAVSNHYCTLVPSQPQATSSYKTLERLASLERWLNDGRQPLNVSQCITRLDTPPIRRDGPPDNWTISSAVYEPDELKTHLAHGFLPASRGAFVEVSLADLAGGPVGLLCQPYGERVTELSREP